MEADECYYIANAEVLRGKHAVNLSVDPPPDLAIEVEVTSSAIDKMGVYAALGICELWRVCETGEVTMYTLDDSGRYRVIDASIALPRLSSRVLTAFVTRLGPIGSKLHSEVNREYHEWLSNPGAV